MAVAKSIDAAATLPDQRKLVAVVYADMVGYSRLIGLDPLDPILTENYLRWHSDPGSANRLSGKADPE